MDKKTHRIISLLLAISLFFAGLYMDTVLTEDLFAYGLTGNMAASLTPVPLDVDHNAICTTELPALHHVYLQSQAKDPQCYGENTASPALSCSAFRSMWQGKSYLHDTAAYPFYRYRMQKELITEYVYRSDGKKRI